MDFEDALFYAATEEPDSRFVTIALDNGIDPNIQNSETQTPLMFASRDPRFYPIVEILLDAGADPNIQTSDGETALMWAIASSNINTTQLLLERGADPNIQTDAGDTASTLASLTGRVDIVELLLNSGPNPMHADNPYDSPDGPNIEQMREEAARNIQRRMRGNRQRRKLTKKRPKYGRMAKPTTERERMRRWTDLAKIYDEEDPIRGYEQFSIYPEWLLPKVSPRVMQEYDENERMAEYLDTLAQYGGYRRNIFI